MSKLEHGKIYITRNGTEVLIFKDVGDNHIQKLYTELGCGNTFVVARSGNHLGITKKNTIMYDNNGVSSTGNTSLNIVFPKTITIDGKDIVISEESFQELKRSLLDD